MSNKKNKSEPCVSKERLAAIAKDNPDLSIEFIEEILKGQQDVEEEVESYENDKEKARKEEFRRMVKELMDQYGPVLKKLSKS